MCFPVTEVPILKAAGKGVTGIKLRTGDRVIAFDLARNSLGGPTVVTSNGRELVVRERKFGLTKRGNRGSVVLKRGTIDAWVRGPVLRLGVPDSEPELGDDDVLGEEL